MSLRPLNWRHLDLRRLAQRGGEAKTGNRCILNASGHERCARFGQNHARAQDARHLAPLTMEGRIGLTEVHSASGEGNGTLVRRSPLACQAVLIRLGSGSEGVADQSNEADNDPPNPACAGLPPAPASAVSGPEP